MLNATDIKSLFLIPFLTKIEGETTYNDIREAPFKLKTNAGSVHSDLVVGGNSLLGLVLSPSLYLILGVSVFNIPLHPGYLPVIPDRSTVATTIKLMQQHNVHTTQFDITKSCDGALKKQILAAYCNDYVEVVFNANAGFAQTKILELLNHLYDSYGTITTIKM